MSSSFALIRFEKTGNIYYGCYNGTSDILIPFLCTPAECYNPLTDCYCAISYCRDLSKQHDLWRFPDDVSDVDNVEIYSDYGGGFYWHGVGSESAKMVNHPLDPFEECDEDVIDGEPVWVKQFLEELEKET
jgi:hypothetical protein